MHILEELYIGNVRPGERSFKRNSQYARALAESSDAVDELIATLTDEQKSSLMRSLTNSGRSVC